jgi:FAD:protein FMN transferase
MTVDEKTRPAWRWPATGTTWQIHHSGGVGAAAARAAAELVEQDEARWSRFRPQSEVSELNRRAGRWVSVSPETLDLLAACRRWTTYTDGVFQPLVGAAVIGWGYQESVLHVRPFADAGPPGGSIRGEIDVERRRGKARIPAGMRLDLGGIAKGWMALRAGLFLSATCDDDLILVDAGGDITAARGDHVVAVERAHAEAGPAGAEPLCVRVLEGQGIATSGSGRRRWVNGDGTVAHHLVDPDLGRPGPESQATVIADDCVAADVLAKTLALRPRLIRSITFAAMVTAGGACAENAAWGRAVAA